MIKYRFKIILKEKVVFFWTLLFPMLLATFFNVTLRDAFNVEKMVTLNVAVLQDASYDENPSLQALLSSLDMIDVRFVVSNEEGLKLLKDNQVDGYLKNSEGLELVVETSNTASSTLSYIFDRYQSKAHMIETMLAQDPSLASASFFEAQLQIKDVFEPNESRNNETVVVIYFYTTLAMLCVYAGQWGIKSASYLQADSSDVAKRLNIAPTSKISLLLKDISVVYLIYLLQFVILFTYLKFVLKVPFGAQVGIICATALMGGLASILIGYSVKIIFGAKASSIISFGGMIASFLSGMQFVGIKYLVEQHLPILAHINPAALITDNFYITYYYQDMSRAYLNLGILALMSFLIALLTIYKMKGVSYDSI